MATPIEEKRQAHAAKTVEAQQLFDAGDYAGSKKSLDESDAIAGEIEIMSSAPQLKSRLEAAKSWANDPTGGTTNAVSVAGFKSAGYAEIQSDGKKSVLYQEGEGLLSDAQIKTIRDPAYAVAFKSYLRAKGNVSNMPHGAMKTLSEGQDDDGGFLVPAEVLEKIIERKPTPTRIAGSVTSLTTSRDALLIPKVNYSADDIYTTGIRVNWTGERGRPGQADGPKFGNIRFSIFTAMLQLNATNDLLEDTGFALNAWIAGKFRETVDILRDDMALRGTGVGQPSGMLTGIGQPDRIAFVKSGAAADITADSLIDMAYTIPEQYMDNCRFLMNRTNTERRIAKLKDADDRYLFATGRESDTLANARPDRLLGFDLMRSALMPNIEANKFPVIFGDPTGYYQIERIGFTIRILTELQALENETIILGRLRMGGDIAEPWKLRAMKVAA